MILNDDRRRMAVGKTRPASAPDVRSLPDRIASCAAATPSRLAVADANVRLTYEELEKKSSTLAARLQEAGAGPERCVGIFLQRSTHFVVAALAALKSGAAYVPFDPSTPAERVALTLADAGVVALLTDSRGAKYLPESSWPVIAIDRIDAKPSTALARMPTDPDTLAYVVYTSGSTGQPKGVEITHANLCNLIEWHQSAFAVSATDRASQVAANSLPARPECWVACPSCSR